MYNNQTNHWNIIHPIQPSSSRGIDSNKISWAYLLIYMHSRFESQSPVPLVDRSLRTN